MEWSIDSYDWVMTPNIMGMSQYADNGVLMTRPYFSSSAYIIRMSNGHNVSRHNVSGHNDWKIIWDAKYYAFIADNIDSLSTNYATARQIYHYRRKTQDEKTKFINIAKHKI